MHVVVVVQKRFGRSVPLKPLNTTTTESRLGSLDDMGLDDTFAAWHPMALRLWSLIYPMLVSDANVFPNLVDHGPWLSHDNATTVRVPSKGKTRQ